MASDIKQEKNHYFQFQVLVQPKQLAYLGKEVHNQSDSAVAVVSMMKRYANVGCALRWRKRKHSYKSYPKHNCTTKILHMLILDELYSSSSKPQLTKQHGRNDKAKVTKLVFQTKCNSIARKGLSYRFHKRHTNRENGTLDNY